MGIFKELIECDIIEPDSAMAGEAVCVHVFNSVYSYALFSSVRLITAKSYLLFISIRLSYSENALYEQPK